MAKLGKFVPKRIPLEEMLPLCFAFCGNVLLPNLSLAHSSVTFYQLCRILVTPGTAILNFFIYQVMISRNQALAIVPICLGIATTTYSDLSEKASDQTTSIIGVIFAFSGVIVSAIYVIWMGRYFKSFSVSSLQLLYNQAPISVILLFIFIPYIDTIPPLNEISTQQIGMIMLSGMFAILINMSQFYIVHGTSALTSTIVGHLKTCSIVTLGWVTGGTMRGMSVLGVAIAVIGIIQYSAVIHMQKAKLGNK
jgi:solute carrier family 35 protein E3